MSRATNETPGFLSWPQCGHVSPLTGDRCHYVPSWHEGTHVSSAGEQWLWAPSLDGKFRFQVKRPDGNLLTIPLPPQRKANR